MCDGDKLLVIKDKNLVNCAKRNMKDIVPLAYDLRKAKPSIITSEVLYNGMIAAYTGGNIGSVSNNISKIWNCGNITQEALDAVKLLCFENNAVIDYAKTLWKPARPVTTHQQISGYTNCKLPNFFIYAKDKTPSQVEEPNNSTMCRISDKIHSSRIKWNKSIGKFEYIMLMDNVSPTLLGENNRIIRSYDYWNVRQNIFNNNDDNIKNDDLYAYKKIREQILKETELPLSIIVNSLVGYLYSVRPNSSKKLLWGAFGDCILANIKNNVSGKVCPVCGKRFSPRDSAQRYCGNECYHQAAKARAAEFKKKVITAKNL